jgi:hypothetical protein
MRAFEFLIEQPTTQGDVTTNPLGLRAEVIDAIKNLPDDKESKRIIQKVKDLLTHVDVGSSLEAFKQKLEPIAANDTDVEKAMNQLTNLIAAAAARTTVGDRDFLMKKWSADQIVKKDRLRTAGKNFTIDQMFNFYNKSQAITFIVDALSKVEGYGMGKGEVVFAVLSKAITKASKGDLEILDTNPDGTASSFKIEVKATDGGSPRFSDQEVKTGPGYEQKRDELIEKYRPQLEALKAIKATGVNLNMWIAVGQDPKTDKDGYYTDTLELLEKIFPGQDNTELAGLIASGKDGASKALYSNKTFERYMNMKNDDVVMYINFAADTPTYTIFTTVEDLAKIGFRFHAQTIYILGQGTRSTYPQMSVVAS